MDPNLDSKQRYAELKKRMKHLLHENESYKQEIAKVNERLLNVSKDKAFLLDQLLQFEDNDSSTESELSDSDQDRKLPEPPKKKPRQRKPKAPASTSQVPNSWSTPPKGQNRTTLNLAAGNSNLGNHGGSSHSKVTSRSGPSGGQGKRRSKQDNPVRNKSAVGHGQTVAHIAPSPAISKVSITGNHSSCQSSTNSAPSSTLNRNTLTAEEVERHLQAKSEHRIQMPQPTSLTLPAELFNDDAFMTDFGPDRGAV